MMTPTSRDLVKKTLEFRSPERVPRQLWTLPWAKNNHPQELAEIQRCFPDDIVGAPACLRSQPEKQGDPYVVGTFVDEWGCVFENVQAGVHGEVKTPALADWTQADAIRFPEELLTVDVDAVNAFCRGTDKYVIAGACPRPFERLQFYRKSENLYLDLAEQRPEMLAFLDRLHRFFVRQMELWAQTEVDALTFMDDWGAQRALLISPAMWRRLFKPLYRDYIDIAHRHGKAIFMHSDGYISPIIADLVELGLDALNCQLFTMDIEALGRQFAGKITFWGELDRQRLLPSGTPAEIDRAVRRVKAALWRDGGCIAQCEFGPGGRPENVYQMFKTWEDVI
jgi:hypothetical protein